MKTKETSVTEPGKINTRENNHHFSTPLEKELIPCMSDKMEFNPYSPPDPLVPPKSKYITFGNFFENPKIMDESELSDTEIKTELTILKNLFASKRLSIDSFTNIDDRTMYRFITEEFLKTEMTGSLHCDTRYIYEEFHSNEIYQIKKKCSDFLRAFFKQDFIESKISMWKDTIINYDIIKNYRNRFSEFDEVNIELLSLNILDDLAVLEFSANYAALHIDQVMISRFNGNGKCNLSKYRGNWHLCLVKIPGI